ncbi:acyl-CoA-binding domain-containing protein 5 isoform X1 [Capsicum annuum]|uniref:acyl-CoA-binding domain-containing protein 5 isoform X1 n=1 Tax=Capsicum annuum TaxID=4072 RepID=UPI001FB082AD|nr:acyl-CoA-binding domain-containing protein 5 isoform X1 [Capsicum annuum]
MGIGLQFQSVKKSLLIFEIVIAIFSCYPNYSNFHMRITSLLYQELGSKLKLVWPLMGSLGVKGCRGGLYFSDVLVLNLEAMAWNILVKTRKGPGPRDSHSVVLVGHRMVVFRGTNGSRKVNDIHVLDVRGQEWTQHECQGSPPSQSHGYSCWW